MEKFETIIRDTQTNEYVFIHTFGVGLRHFSCTAFLFGVPIINVKKCHSKAKEFLHY